MLRGDGLVHKLFQVPLRGVLDVHLLCRISLGGALSLLRLPHFVLFPPYLCIAVYQQPLLLQSKGAPINLQSRLDLLEHGFDLFRFLRSREVKLLDRVEGLPYTWIGESISEM